MTAGVAQAERTVGRAVVCDDDALVRSVVAQVLADSAIDVVGEAESPDEALDLVDRYGANIVIVDLALRGGSGEDLIRALRNRDDETRIVVYSAYGNASTNLVDAGATAVVDKPDFNRLSAVLAEIVSEMGGTVERRRASQRSIQHLPSAPVLSISGLEPWPSLIHVADLLEPGDSILVLDVLPTPSLHDAWDGVLELDHRVALARALAATRRAQDRVSITPGGRPVALLVAGQVDAPQAVFHRVVDRWNREVASGTPVGSFGILREGERPSRQLVEIEEQIPLSANERLRSV